MIEIVVVSRQGAPMGEPLAARFGPEGGTIGRADSNTLVLDDPERTVSRVHAQVLCREGRYVVIDRGSNPMHCNGQALGSGKEAVLNEGDQLLIGHFGLQVRALRAAAIGADSLAEPTLLPSACGPSGDDPFADLLQGLTPVAAPSSASVAPDPEDSASSLLADPMAARVAGAATSSDPFADLLAPAEPALPAFRTGSDDFSDLGLPAASPLRADARRIDELFGGVGAAGAGGDPLALSPLADPLLMPNTSGAKHDPLAAFGALPATGQAARADHAPIGQFGFTPPQAIPDAPAASTPPTPSVPLGRDDDNLGFDDQTGQPIRIKRGQASPPPGAATAAPLARSTHAETDRAATGLVRQKGDFDDLLSGLAPAPIAAGIGVAPPPAAAARSDAAPATASTQASQLTPAAASLPTTLPESDAGGELLSAFLRGLGPVHQAPTSLTPALMERIGVLLRSSTEGTLQLLLTRQELKREVRAEVTMIAAQANNPLKFSPTADVALAHLLGPGIRGFMPAEAAMRDAYDDLRAHQFGVMVGMRAALAHVIERFGPETLEKKIAARSALDSLFAAGRKAKLWDQFIALYGSIAAEAEDDFHSLFGKAFLQAYEDQMARLKSGAPQPPG